MKGPGMKGTGFSPYRNSAKSEWALQAAEKLCSGSVLYQDTTSVVPQASENKQRALAPEGCFSLILPPIPSFSAACLAPEGEPFQTDPLPLWRRNATYLIGKHLAFPFRPRVSIQASSGKFAPIRSCPRPPQAVALGRGRPLCRSRLQPLVQPGHRGSGPGGSIALSGAGSTRSRLAHQAGVCRAKST